MSNCVAYTLAGLVQDCETSKGGIKKVFIATEDPKPISGEYISLNLTWYGFGIVKDGDKYVYSADIINPNDSTYIEVYKGDVIEFTLDITQDQTAEIAIGDVYGPEEEILELKSFDVSKQHNKIRLKIGEDFGKSLTTNKGYLSIHLGEMIAPTGSTAYNIKEFGKIVDFNNNVEWYEYNFKKNTSSMTSTLNVDVANGVNYVSTELVLQFNKMNTVKRIEMQGLAVNDMWVIVQDSNNTYFYLGYNEPVNATAGGGETGTAKTDGNKYTITLTDESDTWPYEISKEALPIIPIINVYSGLNWSDLKRSTQYSIDGEIKQGNTITFSAWGGMRMDIYDKDTRQPLNENYSPVCNITLDKPSGIYNIAVIVR